MLELSLFTGSGGGLLGSKLLGWQTVGAVEIDDYCVKVLETRQNEGYLDDFPIWHMDIREFNRRVAGRYCGLVDVVSAGFPCQPFSVAGKQLAEDDARNMWPATIECIRAVRPRFCFLENVPALYTNLYFGTILEDLEAAGYDTERPPVIVSACQEGAPHTRERLFFMADTKGAGFPEPWGRSGEATEYTRPSGAGWWKTEPALGRVVDGVADRVGQLRSLGNGQVPAVAATAWRLLSKG